MPTGKNWLWALLLAAALCGTAAAQSGADAPSQPQATGQNNADQSNAGDPRTQKGSSIHSNSASDADVPVAADALPRQKTHEGEVDTYVPDQPAAQPVLKHPSNQCVTHHDPRQGCTVDSYGEKGSPCKCITDDDGDAVRGKLE